MERPDAPAGPWWSRPGPGIGLPLVVGLVHVALVAPHYVVGSFDDDSSYILTAKALLAGRGLTGHLDRGGAIVAGVYPPGFGALIAPLVWLWPHNYVPLRLLSVVCYAALFAVTWLYLRRRAVGPLARMAVLGVLALGPPLATFGGMVMAETPYLLLLMVLFLLVDTWVGQDRIWTWTGGAVVLAAPALVWLKEAGIGAVIGLVLWLGLRRRNRRAWGRALAVAGSTVLLLLPVVIARLVAGVPLAGARYSQELGGFYQGGLAGRLLHVVPTAFEDTLSTALPRTLVPYGSPLPNHGGLHDLAGIVAWHVTVLVVLGAVVWWRRHRDAAIVVGPVYLAETLLWPYINERRIILVVPVLAAWYVLGAAEAWRLIRSRLAPPVARRPAGALAGVLAVLVVVVPLVVQSPRDYLFPIGQDSSKFPGSRYAAVLGQLGVPTDVVETDYLYSTALFGGHATANSAFNAVNNTAADYAQRCTEAVVRSAMAADRAAYLLLGDVNKPHVLDSPCILSLVRDVPWAARILATARDDASVYELIGPGTGNPSWRDVTGSAPPVATPAGAGGPAAVTWDWGSPAEVAQVSVGEARAAGRTGAVTAEIRRPDGTWVTVASAPGRVGDGGTAFLLARLAPKTVATALRVEVTGSTGGAPPVTADVHALGPGPLGPVGGS